MTNASPFNSQTALIAEKKYFSGNTSKGPNHYYAENLRNNTQRTLNGSRIYDPLDKDQDADYKQLDPLLSVEQSPSTDILMDSQNEKPPKDVQDKTTRMPSTEFQKSDKPTIMRYTTQVSLCIYQNIYQEYP